MIRLIARVNLDRRRPWLWVSAPAGRVTSVMHGVPGARYHYGIDRWCVPLGSADVLSVVLSDARLEAVWSPEALQAARERLGLSPGTNTRPRPCEAVKTPVEPAQRALFE